MTAEAMERDGQTRYIWKAKSLRHDDFFYIELREKGIKNSIQASSLNSYVDNGIIYRDGKIRVREWGYMEEEWESIISFWYCFNCPWCIKVEVLNKQLDRTSGMQERDFFGEDSLGVINLQRTVGEHDLKISPREKIGKRGPRTEPRRKKKKRLRKKR